MRANTKTALVIGALIVLAAAAGAGVFVSTGSQTAVWFVLVGVPLVVVVGVALYVRGTVTSNGTSEEQFVRKRARSIAEDVQSIVRDLNELEDAYPRWDPGIDSRTTSLLADLRAQGVDIDRETGAVQFAKTGKRADLQELEHLAAEGQQLRDAYERRFEDFVRTELDALESSLQRLDDADIAGVGPIPTIPDEDGSLDEFREALDDARDTADEAISESVSTIREIGRGETRPESGDAKLEDATAAADRCEYDSAVESVLDARDRFREQFSDSFDAERDGLLELIESVEAIGVSEFVDIEQLDAVDSVETRVSDLDSPLDVTTLSRQRTRLRRTCIDMIETMERRLADDARTLREADIPAGYYSEPAVVDETFTDSLEAADDLETFTERWTAVAEQLVEALETVSVKATVVDAYDDVAPTIESELETADAVTAADLPVHHADQFFGLYYRRNPSITFDPEEPALRRGSVETSDVTVEITYERGGPVRTATIELSGRGFSETGTIETRIAGSTTFTDVPHGTHTISAAPGASDFTPVEREIEVDGDATVRIEFVEQTLRERVCADVDIDVESLLPDVSPRLESLFGAEGYVSTSMDLPVKAAYAPCLLTVWADENGYEVSTAGDEIVAFDRDRIERELEGVVADDIGPGESRSYGDLRRDLLSVPLPDSVIRDVATDIETEHRITTTETEITVE